MLGNGRAAWFGVSIGGKKEGPRIYHNRPLCAVHGQGQGSDQAHGRQCHHQDGIGNLAMGQVLSAGIILAVVTTPRYCNRLLLISDLLEVIIATSWLALENE